MRRDLDDGAHPARFEGRLEGRRSPADAFHPPGIRKASTLRKLARSLGAGGLMA